MANVNIEYLDGNSGANWLSLSSKYSSVTYTDTLHHPQRISIKILNSSGSKQGQLNDLEGTFKRYQKIRLTEGNTDKIIFYGRIDKIIPEFNEATGQVLSIEASDGLMELMKNTVNTNADYSNLDTIKRSTVIKHLINGDDPLGKGFPRAIRAGNINTDNISDSTEVDPNFISLQLKGSKKNVLRVIEEISQKESSDDGSFAYDFYLDNPESDTPDFKYFKRGENPLSTEPLLNLKFRGKRSTSNNIIGIRPDYSFPRASDEIITKVRIDYNKKVAQVTIDDDGNEIIDRDTTTIEPQTVYVILIKVNNGGSLKRTGLPFSDTSDMTNIAGVVRWVTEGNEGEANIIKIIEGNNGGSDTILLGNTREGGIEKLLSPITSPLTQDSITVAEIISGLVRDDMNTVPIDFLNDFIIGAGGSIVSSLQASLALEGSIRDEIGVDTEYVIEGYEFDELGEAINEAIQVLSQSNDDVIRGKVSIVGFPYTGTGSNAVLLRAGMRVNLQNIPSINTFLSGTDKDNVNAIVTKIMYVEGIASQHTEISLLVNTNDIGIGLPPNSLVELSRESTIGRFNSENRYANTRRTILRPNQQGSTWEFSGKITKDTISPTDTIIWGKINSDDPDLTLILVNNDVYKIDDGKATVPLLGEPPVTDIATYWLYLNTSDTPDENGFVSFKQTKNRQIAFAGNNVVIAWFKAGVDYVQFRMLGYPWHSLVAEPFSESILDHTVTWTHTENANGDEPDTISWVAGIITLTSGTEYIIEAGSITQPTGELIPAATISESEEDLLDTPATTLDARPRYFLFYDINNAIGDTNTAPLSLTYNVNSAVGSGKIMIALVRWQQAFNNRVSEYHNKETLIIDGGFIGANTITSNHIAANTIAATEINVGAVIASKLEADLALTTRLVVLPDTIIPDEGIKRLGRIEIVGRISDAIEGRASSPGIYGYYPQVGMDAVEQFRFDSDSGQIVMSRGHTGSGLVLDGDGITIFDNITETDGTSPPILQIIGSDNNLRHYSFLNSDEDEGFSSADNIKGTIIVGDSMNETSISDSGIVINKDRIALNNSIGIQWYSGVANTIKKTIQHSSVGLEGIRANINTSIGDDAGLNVEAYDSNGMVASAIHLGYNGMITFTGMVALGDTTANFESIETNILPATTNMRNIGSDEKQWVDLYLSNRIYFSGSDYISISGTGDDAVLQLNGEDIEGGTTTGDFVLISDNDDSQLIRRNLIPDVRGLDPNPFIYRNLGNNSGQRWGFLYVNSIDSHGNSLFEHIGPQSGGTYDLGVYDNNGVLTVRQWRNIYTNSLTIYDDITLESTARIMGNILPYEGSLNIGSSGDRWNDIFASSINLTGDLALNTNGRVDSHLIPKPFIDTIDLIESSSIWNLGSIDDNNRWLTLYVHNIDASGLLSGDAFSAIDSSNFLSSTDSTQDVGRSLIPIVGEGVVNNLGSLIGNRRWSNLYVNSIDADGNSLFEHIGPQSGGTYDLGVYDNNGVLTVRQWRNIYTNSLTIYDDITLESTARIMGNILPYEGSLNIGSSGDRWNDIFASSINLTGDLALNTNGRVDSHLIPKPFIDTIDLIESSSIWNLGSIDDNNRWLTLYVHNIDASGLLSGDAFSAIDSSNFLSSTDSTQDVGRSLIPIVGEGVVNNLGSLIGNRRWSNLYVNSIDADGNSLFEHIGPQSGGTYDLGVYDNNGVLTVRQWRNIYTNSLTIYDDITLESTARIMGNILPYEGSLNIGSSGDRWNDIFASSINLTGDLALNTNGRVDSHLIPKPFIDTIDLIESSSIWNLGSIDDNNRWLTLYVHNIDASGLLSGDAFSAIDSSNFLSISDSTQEVRRDLIPDVRGLDPNPFIYRNLGNNSGQRWGFLYVNSIDSHGNSLFEHIGPQSGGTYDLGVYDNNGVLTVRQWRNIYTNSLTIYDDITLESTARIMGNILPYEGSLNIGSSGDRWNDIFASSINLTGDLALNTNGRVDSHLIPKPFIDTIDLIESSSIWNLGSIDDNNRWLTLYVHNIDASGLLSGDAFSAIDSSNFLSISDSTQEVRRDLIPDVRGLDPNPFIYRNLGNNSGQRWGFLYVNSIDSHGNSLFEHIGPQSGGTYDLGVYDNNGVLTVRQWRNIYTNSLTIYDDITLESTARIMGNILPYEGSLNIGSSGDRWNDIFASSINLTGDLALNTNGRVDSHLIPKPFIDTIDLIESSSIWNLGSIDDNNRWLTLYVHNIDASGLLSGDAFSAIDSSNFLSSTDSTQDVGRSLIPIVGEGVVNNLGSLIGNRRWSNLYVNSIDADGNSLFEHIGPQSGGTYDLGVYDNNGVLTVRQWRNIYTNSLTIYDDITLESTARIMGNILPYEGSLNIGSSGDRWNDIFASSINLTGDLALNTNGRVDSHLIPKPFIDTIDLIESSSIWNLGSIDDNNRWLTLYVHNIDASGLLSGDAFSAIDSSNFLSISDSTQEVRRDLIPDVRGLDPNPFIYRNLGNNSGQRWGTLFITDINMSGSLLDETGTAIINETDGDIVLDENNRVIRNWIPQSSFDITDTEIASILTLGSSDNLYRWDTLYVRNIDMIGNLSLGTLSRVNTDLIPSSGQNLGSDDDEWANVYTDSVTTKNININAITSISSAITIVDGYILFMDEDTDIYVGSRSDTNRKYSLSDHSHEDSEITLDISGNISQHLIPTGIPEEDDDNEIVGYTPQWDLGGNINNILSSWGKLYVEDIYFTGTIYNDGSAVDFSNNIDLSSISQNLIPSANNMYNLGSMIFTGNADRAWREINTYALNIFGSAGLRLNNGDLLLINGDVTDGSGNTKYGPAFSWGEIPESIVPSVSVTVQNLGDDASISRRWSTIYGVSGNFSGSITVGGNIIKGLTSIDPDHILLDSHTTESTAHNLNNLPFNLTTGRLSESLLPTGTTLSIGNSSTNRFNFLFAAGINITGNLVDGNDTTNFISISDLISGNINIPWNAVPESIIPSVGLRNLGGNGENERWNTIFSSSGNFSGSIRVNGDIYPNMSDTSNLGSSISIWNNLFITGSITNGTDSISISDLISGSTSVDFTTIASNVLPSGTRTLGSGSARWASVNAVSGNFSGNITVSGSILPNTANISNLGGNNLIQEWNTLYVENIRRYNSREDIIFHNNIIPSSGSLNLGDNTNSSTEWDTLYVSSISRYNSASSIFVNNNLVPEFDNIDLGGTSLSESWDNLYVNDIIVYNNIRDGLSTISSNYYLRHQEVNNESAYNAISNKASNVLYWWSEA